MLVINKDITNLLSNRKITFNPCRKTQTCFACKMDEDFEVHTLEGIMTGKDGDYLMMGVNGEYYPCAKEIFQKSYAFINK